MDEFDQVKLLRIILYIVLIVILVRVPIQRLIQRNRAKEGDPQERTTGSVNVSDDPGAFEKEKSKAEECLLKAGKRFCHDWEKKRVDPRLLTQFFDILTDKGITKSMLSDAMLLHAQCLDDPRDFFVIYHLYNYIFMTWSGFPFVQDNDAIENSASVCQMAEIKTIELVAPYMQHEHPGTGQDQSLSQAIRPGEDSGSEEPRIIREVEALVDSTSKKLAESDRLRGVLQESGEISLDVFDELVKLDELRKRGILTEEEFEAQKTKVLASS